MTGSNGSAQDTMIQVPTWAIDSMIIEIERCELVRHELEFSEQQIGRLREVIARGERVVELYSENRNRMLEREKTYQKEIEIVSDDRDKWKRRFELTAAGLVVVFLVGVLF